MTFPCHAATRPNRLALIDSESGDSLTYGALNDASRRLAVALRSKLTEGSRVAFLMENGLEYFIAGWASRRSGFRSVPVNWHLTAGEAAYIVNNSNAEALIASPSLAQLAIDITNNLPAVHMLISAGGAFGEFKEFGDILEQSDSTEFLEVEGNFMFYSSGTTGRPKGILRPLSHEPFGTHQSIESLMEQSFGVDSETIFYSPAPLYHAAPLGWSMGIHTLGGTVVQTRQFDAEQTLRDIERFRITHAQFVPTHFVRLLKLPEAVRTRYDLSSLRMVIHAAAPCPIDVKDQMIEWWGPIITEFYGASEGGGVTVVTASEWLSRKGTVGRSVMGRIHIVDDEGNDVPNGTIGHVAFEDPQPFEYHGEPVKTAEFFDERGWARQGDMGWIDDDGYLYLADRASNMIISGGVNIYPQEIEAILTLHPAVGDVAVIGIPHSEMGEEVKAVIEPAEGASPGDDLAAELVAYCRKRLASFKCPRSIDFIAELPRLPSGKLLKREIRNAYWPKHPSHTVPYTPLVKC